MALAHEARSLNPDAPEPAFLLCCLLLARQDPEANALLGTLAAFNDFAPGWEELGHTLLKQQPAAAQVAFGRAAEAYTAMEARTPSAALAYQLGRALRQSGQLTSARDAMLRATTRDPAASHAWFTLGLICQDLGDGPGAIRAFRGALAAQPDFHEAAFNLGVACQEGGDLDAALGRLRARLASAPGRIWPDRAVFGFTRRRAALAASLRPAPGPRRPGLSGNFCGIPPAS